MPEDGLPVCQLDKEVRKQTKETKPEVNVMRLRASSNFENHKSSFASWTILFSIPLVKKILLKHRIQKELVLLF
jgi:hypothetical protein